jgi:RNA polymerase sigma-70 factor (ECF subfamily)
VCSDDLAAKLADGLDAAFEALVLAYQRRLYAFALRLVGRREDAEEIVQDAFVRAYRALVGYPAERIRALALRAWLFQITLNVARNRRRGGRPESASLDGGLDGDGARAALDLPGDARDWPEPQSERAETRRELAALLLTLPARYRAVVILRHVEGLGYAEIARVVSQPVGTVKANVHRGVRLLRATPAARALGELSQMSEAR